VGAIADPQTIAVYTNYDSWLHATWDGYHYPPNTLPPLSTSCPHPWCHFSFVYDDGSRPYKENKNQYTTVSSSVGAFGAPSGVFVGAYDQVWTDRVTRDGGESTTWSVTPTIFGCSWLICPTMPLYAFGGYWDFSPGGYGQGLTLSIVLPGAGSVGVGWILNPSECNFSSYIPHWCVPDGSWFGIVTNFPFTDFTIRADGQPGNAESFELAGLDLVSEGPPETSGGGPEPGSIALLGTGTLALAGVLRRKLLL